MKLTWIVAALVVVGLIVAVGVVLLTGSDDDGDTASTEETAAAVAPVASLPAPASPAAQAAAIAELEQFWTPQRLEEALSNPLSPPPGQEVPDEPAGSTPVPSVPAGAVAEAEPTEGSSKSATVTQGACKQPRALPPEAGFAYQRFCYRGPLNGYPARTSGRLISVDGEGGIGFCTATVAAATNKSVVVTAGHCVVDPAAEFQDGKPRWNKRLGFIPSSLVRQFHRAIDSPSAAGLNRLKKEIWWALPIQGTDFSTVWSVAGWSENGYHSHDFAAVVIARRGGQTIQAALGSQGWDMTGKFGYTKPRLLGFPSAKPFNGRQLFECRGTAQLLKSSKEPDPELVVGCDMSPGSSGGPWLVRTNPRGLGTIISVNSHGPPNIMVGPRLSPVHFDAMAKAQTTDVG